MVSAPFIPWKQASDNPECQARCVQLYELKKKLDAEKGTVHQIAGTLGRSHLLLQDVHPKVQPQGYFDTTVEASLEC
jgi:hypothetical protein